jgi:hypothetical protein
MSYVARRGNPVIKNAEKDGKNFRLEILNSTAKVGVFLGSFSTIDSIIINP